MISRAVAKSMVGGKIRVLASDDVVEVEASWKFMFSESVDETLGSRARSRQKAPNLS